MLLIIMAILLGLILVGLIVLIVEIRKNNRIYDLTEGIFASVSAFTQSQKRINEGVIKVITAMATGKTLYYSEKTKEFELSELDKRF